ncbi:Protein ZW2 [Linum grandiflorum]
MQHHHRRSQPPARAQSSSSSSSAANAADLFAAFFDGWLVRQQHYNDELQTAVNSAAGDDDLIRDLVSRALTHYQHYYEEKSRLAHSDVFILFSPPWFTSLERSFFWIAGFKPGLAFRVLRDSVTSLSPEQDQSLKQIKEEIRVEERLLNDELARIHESVGSPPVSAWARRRVTEEEANEAAPPPLPEGIKSDLETVVLNADTLRTTTVMRIGQVLNPRQNLEFVAAGTRLQLSVRALGFGKSAR